MQQTMLESYRGLTLDDFQKEAIYYLEQGASVFVSAPTGTGKTLIADYIIEKDFRAGVRVIYTAPIKALSNQKYKQFKALVGEENVGIVTGDVVTNERAPIVLMTTEIFRNMLLENNDDMQDVSHVIFDEIHYIADEERGFVWEESLIFMPPHMRFLGLSATVSNADQLAQWMRTLRAEPIHVIKAFERVVPLEHWFFSPETGITSRRRIIRYYQQHDLEYLTYKDRERRRELRAAYPAHLQLLQQLGHAYLPVLFFVFSRKGTEQCAVELAARVDYLTFDEKSEVAGTLQRHLQGLSWQGLSSVTRLESCLQKGIAFHHAGMLPALKEVVEDLFERRLIKVLYATETFAVGVNFPVRTVCFESYRKFDGRGFRALTNNEYFQMAGRAGRRGIDEKGYVFVNVAFDFFDPADLIQPDESRLEPVKSQFVLSYNSVLNMVQNHTDEEIRELLQKNLLIYQNRGEAEALKSQADTISQQLAVLESERCEDETQAECPLMAEELVRHKKKLERNIRRWLGSRNRNKRAKLKRAQAELYHLDERLETLQVKDCTREQIGHCKRRKRQKRKLHNSLNRVMNALKKVPSDERVYEEFDRKKELLEALRYVSGHELTARGKVAANLHIQELLVTEFLFAGIFHDLTEEEINALAVCVDYEPRRGENPKEYRLVDFRKPERIVRRLQRLESTLLGETTIRFENQLHELAYYWSQGADFNELMNMEPEVTEGDVISAFRRAIDLLRQLRRVSREDTALADKLARCIERLDRDVVEVRL